MKKAAPAWNLPNFNCQVRNDAPFNLLAKSDIKFLITEKRPEMLNDRDKLSSGSIDTKPASHLFKFELPHCYHNNMPSFTKIGFYRIVYTKINKQ